jgi:hypothetical protein
VLDGLEYFKSAGTEAPQDQHAASRKLGHDLAKFNPRVPCALHALRRLGLVRAPHACLPL